LIKNITIRECTWGKGYRMVRWPILVGDQGKDEGRKAPQNSLLGKIEEAKGEEV